MEVYVDDMLVKSLKVASHISNLQETFDVMRKYKMKLNHAKCVFGVASRKFFGFIVHYCGLEVNPSKNEHY